MTLFKPADDEVGLGVISRLWIDKMNQFRRRGVEAHHGQAGTRWSSFVLVIVPSLDDYVTPCHTMSHDQTSQQVDEMGC